MIRYLRNNHGEVVHINKDAQEIVVPDWDGYYHAEMARYKMDGSLIQEGKYHLEEEDFNGERAEFEALYGIYAEPYPQLNFVGNTPENRQKYLLGGVETGWASR